MTFQPSVMYSSARPLRSSIFLVAADGCTGWSGSELLGEEDEAEDGQGNAGELLGSLA